MGIPAQRAGQLGLVTGRTDAGGCQPVLACIKQVPGALDEFDLPLAPVPDGPFGVSASAFTWSSLTLASTAPFLFKRWCTMRLVSSLATGPSARSLVCTRFQEGFGDPIGRVPEWFAEFRPLVRG